MTAIHNAPGPLAGFLWQVDLALLRLFALDFGEHIEIETSDDVVQVRGGGQVLGYVQAKHSLSPAILRPRSADLWKTLRVWVPLAQRLLETGQVSRFELATSDDIAPELQSLLSPSGERDAPSEVEGRKRLADVLDGIAAERPNKKLTAAYDAWRNASQEARSLLLRNVFLLGGQGTIRDTAQELGHCLRRTGAPAEVVDEYRERIIGWFNGVVRERLDTGGCSVEYDELMEVIAELHQSLSPRALPTRHARAAVPEMVAAERGRPYQLQMQLLEATEEEHLTAYEMYTRARLERNEWLERRITGQSDLRDHDNELINVWTGCFRRGKRKQRREQLDPVTTGWEVLDECTRTKSALRGSQVAHHVHVGTLHLLSDFPMPVPSIGWHPEFASLLPGLLKAGDKK